MKIILETERLILRELTAEDAANFYRLNQDHEVVKYTGDVPFSDIEEARQFLLKYDQYKKYRVGRWAVVRKSDNVFLGWCGLKYHPQTNEYDLGFRFFRKYWNQRYATESAKACLKYGFNELHLDSILGHAMKANLASVKVLEKIGMRFDRTTDFEGQEGVLFTIFQNDFSQ